MLVPHSHPSHSLELESSRRQKVHVISLRFFSLSYEQSLHFTQIEHRYPRPVEYDGGSLLWEVISTLRATQGHAWFWILLSKYSHSY